MRTTTNPWRSIKSVRNKHAAKLAMDIRAGLPDVLLLLAPTAYGKEAMGRAIQSITAEDLLNILRDAALKPDAPLSGTVQRSPRSLAPDPHRKGAGA